MGIVQQIINGTYDPHSKPPTAYEALKKWCEQYLGKSQWRATNEDEWGNPTIDIGEATHIFSQDTGRYLHTVFYNQRRAR